MRSWSSLLLLHSPSLSVRPFAMGVDFAGSSFLRLLQGLGTRSVCVRSGLKHIEAPAEPVEILLEHLRWVLLTAGVLARVSFFGNDWDRYRVGILKAPCVSCLYSFSFMLLETGGFWRAIERSSSAPNRSTEGLAILGTQKCPSPGHAS